MLNYQIIDILTNRLPDANLTHALEVKIYTNILLCFFLQMNYCREING